jgi:hypothetical protein
MSTLAPDRGSGWHVAPRRQEARNPVLLGSGALPRHPHGCAWLLLYLSHWHSARRRWRRHADLLLLREALGGGPRAEAQLLL